MTRRKPTDDLRESISQTVADPERAAPTFGEPTGSSETVLLASYAAAIRQNDEAEICRCAGKLLFGPDIREAASNLPPGTR